jgi:hypothetical protein
MPFPSQVPKPFDQANVEGLIAGYAGCYGMFRPGAWIFIGASNDLRASLLAHLNNPADPIHTEHPTHFVTMLDANPQVTAAQLLAELHPILHP